MQGDAPEGKYVTVGGAGRHDKVAADQHSGMTNHILGSLQNPPVLLMVASGVLGVHSCVLTVSPDGSNSNL